jgi:hypothetical protein
MLVDRTPSHFIFETLDTPANGSPPIYRTREFGFTTNDDGSTTFYTIGLSKTTTSFEPESVVAFLQNKTWTDFMQGFQKAVNEHSGQASAPTSFATSVP